MTGLSERQVRAMRGERDNCHLASDVLGVSHGEGAAVPMAMIGQGLDGTVAAAKGPNDEYRVLRTAIVSATPFTNTRSLHSVSAPNAAEQVQRRHKPQFDFTATIASDGTFTSLQGWRPAPDMVFTGTLAGRKYTFTVKEVFEDEDTPEDAPIPFTVKEPYRLGERTQPTNFTFIKDPAGRPLHFAIVHIEDPLVDRRAAVIQQHLHELLSAIPGLENYVRVPSVRDFHTTPRLRVAGVRPVTDTTVTVSDMVLNSEHKPSQTLGQIIARTLFSAQNDRRTAQTLREQGGEEASARQHEDEATRKVDSVLYALYMAGYALRHLWRQGVAHGDFHVGNILLTSNPTTGATIHVIDFGRAVRKRDLNALVGKRTLREYDILQPDDPAVHQRTYKRADDVTVLSASGSVITENYVNNMWQILCATDILVLLESIQRTALPGLDYEVLGPMPFRMIKAVVDGLTRNDEEIPPELRHPPLEPDILPLFSTDDDKVFIDTASAQREITVVRSDDTEYEPSEQLQRQCDILQRITKGLRTTILHYGGFLEDEHTASPTAADATLTGGDIRTKRVTLSGGRAR